MIHRERMAVFSLHTTLHRGSVVDAAKENTTAEQNSVDLNDPYRSFCFVLFCFVSFPGIIFLAKSKQTGGSMLWYSSTLTIEREVEIHLYGVL